ncbi:MAG: methionine--tRNA ligase subunit beta, partial [Polyangiales bacterium]
MQPEGRFNEVKGVRQRRPSRPLGLAHELHLGVPVPGDEKHVMYAWLDALTNYMSALGGPAKEGDAPLYDRFWPHGGDDDAQVVHIVGKDILRFHAVFWPAFLLAAGLQPPSQVFAHGWLTINGEKMSKRFGNFIPPGPLVEAFGADVVRYYLMREVGFGQDGDFAHKQVFARYHGELGNGLGNLLQRIVASILKNEFGGAVPAPTEIGDEERELIAVAEKSAAAAAQHLDLVAPHRALDAIFELVAAANRYVDRTAPWALAKAGDKERLATVCYHVLESLRWLSVMLAPFLPSKTADLRAQLGVSALTPEEAMDQWPKAGDFGGLPAGTLTAPAAPLFPRFDPKTEAEILEKLGANKPAEAAKPAKKEKKVEEKKDAPKAEAPKTDDKSEASAPIAFDDFVKVDLRVGLILEAEAVPKSDKLVRCQIDLGEEKPRQVLAGIRKHYDPEALVGKRVVVVANLAPRKMMGLESHGMILAA